MASELKVLDVSYEANVDLSDYQFRFVCLTGGKVTYVNSATTPSVGILQNNPDIGEAASVRKLGLSKLEAGETLAENDFVKSEDDATAANAGRGIKLVECAGTQELVRGRVEIAAGAAADLATVELVEFTLTTETA